MFPISGEYQESSVELFPPRIDTHRRKGRVAVAVNNLYYLSLVNGHGAMPRLHNEPVARLNISEDNHFVISGL